MEVKITSDAGRIAALLQGKAQRMVDLRPALKRVAEEIDSRTAQSFQTSRRQDGVPWPDLADSTIIGRLRQRKGAFAKASRIPKEQRALARALRTTARNRDVNVRRAGRAIRSGLRSERGDRILAAAKAAGFKPLLNTGRGARSANARVMDRNTIRWSVVEYIVPHIGGAANNRPPQRNPTVFRKVGDGFELRPEMAEFLRRAIVNHVNGAPPAGAP